MRYVTRDGIVLEIGRVERRRLDAVNLPAPIPPTRNVETWGGLVEQMPVYDDPGYQTALYEWRVNIWREQIGVIAAALDYELTAEKQSELDALRALGIGNGSVADYLRFMVSEVDQAAIVELVLYQSTVTPRGIAEAEQRLDYTWRGKPVGTWAVGYTYGKRGSLGVDMRAALRSGLTWTQFCELPGPEQSALVAFWILEERLSWLADNNAN